MLALLTQPPISFLTWQDATKHYKALYTFLLVFIVSVNIIHRKIDELFFMSILHVEIPSFLIICKLTKAEGKFKHFLLLLCVSWIILLLQT